MDMNDVIDLDEEPIETQSLAIPLSFFGLYWKALTIGAIILVVGGFITYQKLRIDHFENLYNNEKLVSKILASNNVELKSSIDKQNKSLDAAKAQTSEIEKKLSDLDKVVNDMRARAKDNKNAGLAKPTPKTDAEVVTLIKDTMDNIKWTR